MHKLLSRQLRRFFGSPEAVPSEWRPFLDAVDEAYRQSDDDRALLENSMETVSEELVSRFQLIQVSLAESRKAEQQLNQALSVLEATLESTADGLLLVDAAGAMLRMNGKFCELWGLSGDVASARDDAQTLTFMLDQLEDPDSFRQKVQELGANPEAESFDTLYFRDHRVVERYSKPQQVGGVTVGRVWSFRDVTARRQLEESLRQSQKMEAIGRLAGGVAHDFNNLLTVLRGHAEFLVDSELTQSQTEDVHAIMKSADRAGALTRQLLAFSRKQVMEPRVLDLNQVVRDVEPMLRRLIGEDIAVELKLAANLSNVTADPGQLEQVLVNLAVNGRDAMPRGGRLAIETMDVDLHEHSARGSSAAMQPGRYVRLSVSDSGLGIPRTLQDRIFEPFFTTKPAGKGTGLGLATVYGIVKQSGGSIALASEEGMGTMFTIHLPAVAGMAEPATAPQRPPAPAGGSETILLAEDEEDVRQFVASSLRLQGYSVIEAGSGQEAVDLVTEQHGRVDLLITDVVMPGVGGHELVEHARGLNGAMPVLYISGYTDDEIVRRGVLQADAGFLQKPFEVSALAHAVRRAIDRSG